MAKLFRYGRPRLIRDRPSPSRLRQHPASKREACAADSQKCSRGAHVVHRQCLVNGTGKLNVQAVSRCVHAATLSSKNFRQLGYLNCHCILC